jgi:phosphate-selective porin OprO/OprP
MPLPDLGSVDPIAMIETTAQYIPAEEEGASGFGVRRLYLGARWRPVSWASVVGSFNAAASDQDSLMIDAFVRAAPKGPLDVSIGYAKTPLFASARDLGIETVPIPELSLATRAFWPGRDTGAEVHLAGPTLPVEAWLRVGNGSGRSKGNDNPEISFDGRADLAFGRARAGAERSEHYGFRLGGGFHLEEVGEREGLGGATPTGFAFWSAPTVAGTVWVAEGHAVGFLGPVMVTLEGAAASEDRSTDADGDPDTPRVEQDPVQSSGGSGEVAWMVTGQHRIAGAWPVAGDRIGIEVAGRGERLSLGIGAADVDPGGATGGELAVRAWHPGGLGAGLTGGYFVYDVAPEAEPGVTASWFVAARVTARWL